jgi:hypothetical protein
MNSVIFEGNHEPLTNNRRRIPLAGRVMQYSGVHID